jgi:PAS domain S-box-containing protein
MAVPFDLPKDLLEAMADGIVVASEDGHILYVNAELEQLSGYDRTELVGHSIEMLVPAPLRATHERHRERYLGAPARRTMGSHLDIRLRRRDGSELPVDIALSPLAEAGGTRVVAVVRDISERRESERVLRERSELLELAHDSILVRALADRRITFWNQGAVEMYGFTRREATGRVAHELLRTVFPEPLPDIERRLERDGGWEGELVQTRRDGSRVIVSSRQVVLWSARRDGGSILEIDRDVTAERRARDRLDAVLTVTQAILAGEEADHVLDLIARRARELVGAALATVAMPEDGGATMRLRVAVGTAADRVLGMRVPAARSLLGRALEGREPILVHDLASDPRTNPEFLAATGMGPALVVPLLVKDTALGTLLVANPPASAPFGGEDLALVQLFAAAAAVAIDYARGRAAVERLLLVEDRHRIANELHGGAIQRLFAIGMSLQHTAALSRHPQVAQRLQGDVAMLDRVIGDLRNYAFELGPDAGVEPDLHARLRDLLSEVERSSGITTMLDAQRCDALDRVAEDVLALVGEALTAIRRDARPRTVHVRIREGEDGAGVLEVADDADGFQPDAPGARAEALGALRERARRLGAELAVEPAPGRGTVLRITLAS